MRLESLRGHSLRLVAPIIVATSFLACGDGPTAPEFGSALGRLAVGEQTACALTADNALYCWGLNSAFFEYGADPATVPMSASPVRVTAPPLMALMVGAAQHMCGQALAISGVFCWGRGSSGQLGTGKAPATGNVYTQVVGSAWQIVTVSRLSSCGVATPGTGFCWGSNQSGEIGTTAVAIGTTSPSPVPLETSESFKMIAAGWRHACGITTAGLVMCWGDNTHGQLGNGTIDPVGTAAGAHRVPVRIASDEKFVMLSAGALQTCGITLDLHTRCWGDNETGQLGDGTKTDRAVPTAVSTDQKFFTVSIGSGFRGGALASAPAGVSTGGAAHTCALTTGGSAYCWGWNGDGQVGDGTTTDRLTPVATQGPTGLSTIGAGGAFSCAMRADQVWCWGSSAAGQLGTGVTNVHVPSPSPVFAPFAQP